MPHQLKDAELSQSVTLPNGANTKVTDPIQLHDGAHMTDFVADSSVLLSAPELGASPLPDGQTITYTIEHSDSESSNYETLSPAIVQTGAGGAGDEAATLRIALPTDVKKYIRGKAVKTGAADASAVSFTVELLF